MNTALEFSKERHVIPPRDTVRRDIPRYVFCLGDFIPPNDKLQLDSVHAWAGGLRIGHSDTEGAPTMWQTKYVIYRGIFTPLEMTAIQSHADVKSRENQQNVGLINALPGDDMLMLSDDSHREMGIVEITALANSPFAEGRAEALNKHFFPELDKWRARESEFPALLSDWVTLIQQAKETSNVIRQTKAEMLTSAQVFESYAKRQIELNRQRIMQTRQNDTGGFTVAWSPRTRLFAAQLGIVLEEDNIYSQKQERIVVSPSGEVQDEWRQREILAREEENRLRREELELRRAEAGLTVKTAPQAETPSTCTATTTAGTPCKNEAVGETGRCNIPAHKK